MSKLQIPLILVTCLYFPFGQRQALVTSIGQVIDKEPTAAGKAVGGGASMNNGPDSYLSNMALLAESEYLQAFTSFRQGLFENNLGVLGVTRRFGSFAFAISLFGLLPQTFSEVNDTGNNVNTFTYTEIATGLHAAAAFNIAGKEVYWGAGTKIFYTQILGQNAYTVLGDAGLLLPFTASWMKILPNSPAQNLRIGVALQNLGPPVNFDSGKGYIESSVMTSFNWILTESRINQTNLFLNVRYQIYEINALDTVVPSIGLQHGFLNFIFLRGSVLREAETFRAALGMGTRYVYNDLYILHFDYAIQPIAQIGDIHTFTLKGSYTFSNFGEKVKKHNESRQLSGKLLTEELVQILQKAINEYALYNRKFPDKLTDALPILEKEYGLKEIPEPNDGILLYDPRTGVVQITAKDTEDFRDKIYLNDGSSLHCNVEKETASHIQVKHRFGSMMVDKGSILKIESVKLNALDAEIIKTVQAYVHDFRARSGRYPRSLEELEQSLKKHNVDRIPVPSSGTLEMDSSNGNIFIRKNKGGGSFSGSESLPGKTDTEKNDASKKDVFDF